MPWGKGLMDFEGRKSNDDYPHKIATGNVNKISSTYGETFIVMSQQRHEYCRFSTQHFPEKITNICLGVFWVILVRAKYHNRMSALQKRQRSTQQIYYHPHNGRGYPGNEFALQ